MTRRGEVVASTEEKECIVFADIGDNKFSLSLGKLTHSFLFFPPDPKVLESARVGIPVTTQRRFDVYTDVSQ